MDIVEMDFERVLKTHYFLFTSSSSLCDQFYSFSGYESTNSEKLIQIPKKFVDSLCQISSYWSFVVCMYILRKSQGFIGMCEYLVTYPKMVEMVGSVPCYYFKEIAPKLVAYSSKLLGWVKFGLVLICVLCCFFHNLSKKQWIIYFFRRQLKT